MKLIVSSLISAALLAGAATSWAGSCCGGGSATSLMVPKFAKAIVDASFDAEWYDGFWNQDGRHISDPPGSDLKQYRVNLGYAHRFFTDWQASVSLPYVWNENKYSGTSSSSNGLGDTTLSLWYDLLDDKSAWRITAPQDLVPAVSIGLSLLLPTGISSYDDVNSSFDVTGRGFYRLDGNLLVEKTLRAWGVSLAMSYGTYFERSINREYNKYVEPYRKELGDRTSLSPSLSYRYFIGSGGDTLTGTVSYAYLNEGEGSFNGKSDSSSRFRKQSVGGSLGYSNTDSDWSVRVGWNHAIQADGWGRNFPTTDIFSIGGRYVFR